MALDHDVVQRFKMFAFHAKDSGWRHTPSLVELWADVVLCSVLSLDEWDECIWVQLIWIHTSSWIQEYWTITNNRGEQGDLAATFQPLWKAESKNRSKKTSVSWWRDWGGRWELKTPKRKKLIWPLAGASTHHFTEGLGVLGELAGIFLLHLPHQPLHFLPLDLLLPLLERRLALDHLVQQAAQRPPVRAEGVPLVFHHLWSWRGARRRWERN